MRTAVHVIATTPEGTRAALVAARLFVADGPIVLVVPSKPRTSIHRTNTLVAQFRSIAEELDQHIQVRVCLCGTLVDAAQQLVPPGATVVIGGAVRWWWPTSEERTAAELRRAGREVVFADQPAEATVHA